MTDSTSAGGMANKITLTMYAHRAGFSCWALSDRAVADVYMGTAAVPTTSAAVMASLELLPASGANITSISPYTLESFTSVIVALYDTVLSESGDSGTQEPTQTLLGYWVAPSPYVTWAGLEPVMDSVAFMPVVGIRTPTEQETGTYWTVPTDAAPSVALVSATSYRMPVPVPPTGTRVFSLTEAGQEVLDVDLAYEIVFTDDAATSNIGWYIFAAVAGGMALCAALGTIIVIARRRSSKSATPTSGASPTEQSRRVRRLAPPGPAYDSDTSVTTSGQSSVGTPLASRLTTTSRRLQAEAGQ